MIQMKSDTSNRPQRLTRHTAGLQSGFTMIEVLIAFLVLAIGLIGMASLQLTSVKSAHSSYYRSIASSIALDLEEQLWVEVGDQTADGCPNLNNVVTRVQTIWTGGLDGTRWASHEIATLPGIGANGAITSDVTTTTEKTPSGTPFWTSIDFVLSWSEQRFESEGETEQFAFTSRVACRPAPPPA